jgi:hypothetical protein
MAVDQDDLDIKSRVRRVLCDTTNPISYGALARDLNVPGPGAIARVTAALEALMRDDAAAGQPFLAAMCEGKLSGGMPARGFFEMAAALGRYTGPASGPEAVAFVAAQRALLARGELH